MFTPKLDNLFSRELFPGGFVGRFDVHYRGEVFSASALLTDDDCTVIVDTEGASLSERNARSLLGWAETVALGMVDDAQREWRAYLDSPDMQIGAARACSQDDFSVHWSIPAPRAYVTGTWQSLAGLRYAAAKREAAEWEASEEGQREREADARWAAADAAATLADDRREIAHVRGLA